MNIEYIQTVKCQRIQSAGSSIIRNFECDVEYNCIISSNQILTSGIVCTSEGLCISVISEANTSKCIAVSSICDSRTIEAHLHNVAVQTVLVALDGNRNGNCCTSFNLCCSDNPHTSITNFNRFCGRFRSFTRLCSRLRSFTRLSCFNLFNLNPAILLVRSQLGHVDVEYIQTVECQRVQSTRSGIIRNFECDIEHNSTISGDEVLSLIIVSTSEGLCISIVSEANTRECFAVSSICDSRTIEAHLHDVAVQTVLVACNGNRNSNCCTGFNFRCTDNPLTSIINRRFSCRLFVLNLDITISLLGVKEFHVNTINFQTVESQRINLSSLSIFRNSECHIEDNTIFRSDEIFALVGVCTSEGLCISIVSETDTRECSTIFSTIQSRSIIAHSENVAVQAVLVALDGNRNSNSLTGFSIIIMTDNPFASVLSFIFSCWFSILNLDITVFLVRSQSFHVDVVNVQTFESQRINLTSLSIFRNSKCHIEYNSTVSSNEIFALVVVSTSERLGVSVVSKADTSESIAIFCAVHSRTIKSHLEDVAIETILVACYSDRNCDSLTGFSIINMTNNPLTGITGNIVLFNFNPAVTCSRNELLHIHIFEVNAVKLDVVASASLGIIRNFESHFKDSAVSSLDIFLIIGICTAECQCTDVISKSELSISSTSSCSLCNRSGILSEFHEVAVDTISIALNSHRNSHSFASLSGYLADFPLSRSFLGLMREFSFAVLNQDIAGISGRNKLHHVHIEHIEGVKGQIILCTSLSILGNLESNFENSTVSSYITLGSVISTAESHSICVSGNTDTCKVCTSRSTCSSRASVSLNLGNVAVETVSISGHSNRNCNSITSFTLYLTDVPFCGNFGRLLLKLSRIFLGLSRRNCCLSRTSSSIFRLFGGFISRRCGSRCIIAIDNGQSTRSSSNVTSFFSEVCHRYRGRGILITARECESVSTCREIVRNREPVSDNF